jgi:hypothetical protein
MAARAIPSGRRESGCRSLAKDRHCRTTLFGVSSQGCPRPNAKTRESRHRSRRLRWSQSSSRTHRNIRLAVHARLLVSAATTDVHAKAWPRRRFCLRRLRDPPVAGVAGILPIRAPPFRCISSGPIVEGPNGNELGANVIPVQGDVRKLDDLVNLYGKVRADGANSMSAPGSRADRASGRRRHVD